MTGGDELSWFHGPSPDGADPGTLNAVFQLLDLAVIGGRADDPVLLDAAGTVTHARLLEDVAGTGGVLRGLGVEPGTPVAWRLEGDRLGVTALLAMARLGAVLDDDAELVVSPDGVADVAWDLVRRAGRTDPAPVAELAATAPWTARRTVLDLARALRSVATPISAPELALVMVG